MEYGGVGIPEVLVSLTNKATANTLGGKASHCPRFGGCAFYQAGTLEH